MRRQHGKRTVRLWLHYLTITLPNIKTHRFGTAIGVRSEATCDHEYRSDGGFLAAAAAAAAAAAVWWVRLYR